MIMLQPSGRISLCGRRGSGHGEAPRREERVRALRIQFTVEITARSLDGVDLDALSGEVDVESLYIVLYTIGVTLIL